MIAINLMRFLDVWVGVPFCFFLSCINHISKQITHTKSDIRESDAPKKILLMKISELGAIVLSYPLLNKIKEELPESELFFLTFKKNASIFCFFEEIEINFEKNILTIRDDNFFLAFFDFIDVIIKIRKEKIQVIIDLEFFSRFTAIITFFANAKKRIGFYHYRNEGLYRGNFLTHRVQYNPFLHMSASFLSLWYAAQEDKKESPVLNIVLKENDFVLPKIVPDEKTRESILKKMPSESLFREKTIILVNPGEGVLPLREWPLENFIALSKKLLQEDKVFLVFIGMGTAGLKIDLLMQNLSAQRYINLLGKTDIGELLELFNLSKALIANDCGLAHLASLTSVKKFILFGPESPKVFGPLGSNNQIFYSNLACSPCFSILNHRQSDCQNNLCLKNFSVEAVYQTVKENLE